jgi:hypothetical protein
MIYGRGLRQQTGSPQQRVHLGASGCKIHGWWSYDKRDVESRAQSRRKQAIAFPDSASLAVALHGAMEPATGAHEHTITRKPIGAIEKREAVLADSAGATKDSRH